MGPLQPGLPSPVAIPRDYCLLIIDLKDCFYTIPLAPQDCQRFAFSVPSVNLTEPMKRYHWKVLPQGMANSPTLCQKFVAEGLAETRENFPEAYIIHYMDDILFAASNPELLAKVFKHAQRGLENQGLKIAEGKVQSKSPYQYLGQIIDGQKIRRQKTSIRTEHLQTLNDWQKLLGDINWIRSSLRLTTGEIKPLFEILKGDPDPTSPRELTPEAKTALQRVEDMIATQFLERIDYNKTWSYLILSTPFLPTGLFWQDGPLEWLHLPSTRKRVITTYYEAVATLIRMGRQRSKQLFGVEPALIVLPYKADQIAWLYQTSEEWGLSLAEFSGQLGHHYPASKLLDFWTKNPIVFESIVKSSPIKGAPTIFTDGSNNGKAVYILNNQPVVFQTNSRSAQ